MVLCRRAPAPRRRARVLARPPWIVAVATSGPPFRPAGSRGSRGAILRRALGIGRWRRCVTPRQTCPRPDGFGRNLRSKTRWFTGFCNSHQVSHFATFFIDARAEISVAESRFGCTDGARRGAGRSAPFPGRQRPRPALSFVSLAPGAPGFRLPGRAWGALPRSEVRSNRSAGRPSLAWARQ